MNRATCNFNGSDSPYVRRSVVCKRARRANGVSLSVRFCDKRERDAQGLTVLVTERRLTCLSRRSLLQQRTCFRPPSLLYQRGGHADARFGKPEAVGIIELYAQVESASQVGFRLSGPS